MAGSPPELEDIFGGADETPAMRTKRLFDENAPFAAAEVIALISNATSDTVKLKAATYVVDRVLGPVGKDDQESALNEFLGGLEKLANGGGR